MAADPHIVVLSSLFPSSKQPGAGLFVRERMFRVAQVLPLTVVCPVPWFPLQGLLRQLRPGARAGAPAFELQNGIEVRFPRFLSVPGVLKRLDGLLMALCTWRTLRRLKREGRLDLIDAHFAYPDGYAASLLGRWLNVPVTITMRGTEARHAADAHLASKVRAALGRVSRVFAVSESLRSIATGLGIPGERVRVVGNGVDLDKFNPLPREEARRRLGLPQDAPVLITVGALVERKGFHRVIELMPALQARHPSLTYLVVGGASPEGDLSMQLRQQVQSLGLESAVRFVGPLPPNELRVPLSAADLFVLSSRNEGWANVLLEAMACGLPVVATHVGGNAEVVSDASLGEVVPFDDKDALRSAILGALDRAWDRDSIQAYARANTWDSRVKVLVDEFRSQHARHAEQIAGRSCTSVGPSGD